MMNALDLEPSTLTSGQECTGIARESLLFSLWSPVKPLGLPNAHIQRLCCVQPCIGHCSIYSVCPHFWASERNLDLHHRTSCLGNIIKCPGKLPALAPAPL